MRRMMICCVCALVLTLSLSMTNGAVAEKQVQVFVNGSKITFDVQPQIIEGRTMVPIRFVADSLGASVTWDNAEKTVTIFKGGNWITLQISKKSMDINGKTIALDVAPVILDNRTLVPLRAIAEGLSVKVTWDKKSYAVMMTAPLSFYYRFSDICNEMVKDYDNGKYGQELFFLEIGGSGCDKSNIIIYSKNDHATIIYNQSIEGRYKIRELSKEEYQDLTSFVADNQIDRLPDFDTGMVCDGVEFQYLHCTKDKESTFYMNNPSFSEGGANYEKLLEKLYNLLSEGDFDIHYKQEEKIRGLKLLIQKRRLLCSVDMERWR